MEWPKHIPAAKRIQDVLRKRVRITRLRKAPRIVGGVDAAFSNDTVIAVACLYRYPEMSPLEDTHAVSRISFPYIPGYLSFREGPAIVKAVGRLKRKPDLILFDGQGIAHPKGVGIASHIGVLLNIPSIGCAKSRLVGEYEEPGLTKGDRSALRYKQRTVGAVLRTKDRVRPLFVSPGHLITLTQCIEIVLRCCTKYRIPEPLRRADHLTGLYKGGLSS